MTNIIIGYAILVALIVINVQILMVITIQSKKPSLAIKEEYDPNEMCNCKPGMGTTSDPYANGIENRICKPLTEGDEDNSVIHMTDEYEESVQKQMNKWGKK